MVRILELIQRLLILSDRLQEETRGNQLCQLASKGNEHFSIKIQIIYQDDRTDYCLPLRIHYLSEQPEKILQERTAISYKFVKNGKGWYIQPCVTVTVRQKVTPQVECVIGININNGFFAVSGAAKDGSFIPFEDIPFPKGPCSETNASKLKEALTDIFRKAEELNYGVAIEDINLSSRKSNAIIHLCCRQHALINFKYSFPSQLAYRGRFLGRPLFRFSFSSGFGSSPNFCRISIRKGFIFRSSQSPSPVLTFFALSSIFMIFRQLIVSNSHV